MHEGGLLAKAAAPGGGRATTALARRVLVAAARRSGGLAQGTIILREGGTERCLGKGEPVVHVDVHDPLAFTSILRGGSVGLGSSYVAGCWDADDLGALVQVLLRWSRPARERLDASARRWGRLLEAATRPAAPRRSDDRRNIRAHYDLSNDFFGLMLDQTMTYSCGYFAGPSTSLESAQLAKIDRLCSALDLQPTDHLLEIGSGWGALAIRAATRYGCRVTTTTISEAQRGHVAKRVADCGLTGQVEVLGRDWRDLDGHYDKLVSVEMIEAVDWRHHDRFLAKCAGLLKKNGLAAVQAIVIEDASFERAKHHQDFVRKMVFPGGCIPSVASIVGCLSRGTDLRVLMLDDIGPHYVQTLKCWEDNLRARATEVRRLGVSENFMRLWSLYLAYCRGAFAERHISDVQMVLAKPAWRGHLGTGLA